MKTTSALAVPNETALSDESQARILNYFGSHIAAGTDDTYKDAFAGFQFFCNWKHHPALPAPVEAVLDCITFMADEEKSVSWIQVTLAAISYHHRMRKMDDPTQDPRVTVIMRGIRRQRKTRPGQKEPITREFLGEILLRLQEDMLVNIRDRALLLLGYAGAFRQSELTSLDVSDVQLRLDEMIVTLRKSKTDQEGRGIVKRIPRVAATPKMCPVNALEQWLAALAADSHGEITGGPLFRKIDRWGHAAQSRMNPRSVAFIVKRDLPLSADSAQFGGHSLRAGFVTQAAQDGTPEYEIQEVTKHKSADMLRRYIRDKGIGQHAAIRRALTGEE